MKKATTKWCCRCLKVKPISQYNKGGNPDGLHSWCKDCLREYGKARRKAARRAKGKF